MHPEHYEREVVHTGIRFPFPKDVTPEERAWLIERIRSVGHIDREYTLSFSEDGELIARDTAESKYWTREGWCPVPGGGLYTSVTRAVECLLLEGPHVPPYQEFESPDRDDIKEEIDRRVQGQRSAVGKCLHTPPLRLLLHLVPFASGYLRTHDDGQRRIVKKTMYYERKEEEKRHAAGQMKQLQAILDEHAGELAQALRNTVAASTEARLQAATYRKVPYLDIPKEDVRPRRVRIAGYPAAVVYGKNTVYITIRVAKQSAYNVNIPAGEMVHLGEGDERFSGMVCENPREGALARLSASGEASLEITLEEWDFLEPKMPPDMDH